jgi:hypothetical protein
LFNTASEFDAPDQKKTKRRPKENLIKTDMLISQGKAVLEVAYTPIRKINLINICKINSEHPFVTKRIEIIINAFD